MGTYIASIKEGSSERDTMKRLDVVDAAITSAGGTVKSIKYLEKKIIFEFQTGRVKEIEAHEFVEKIIVQSKDQQRSTRESPQAKTRVHVAHASFSHRALTRLHTVFTLPRCSHRVRTRGARISCR